MTVRRSGIGTHRRKGGGAPDCALRRSVVFRGIEGGRSHPSPAPLWVQRVCWLRHLNVPEPALSVAGLKDGDGATGRSSLFGDASAPPRAPLSALPVPLGGPAIVDPGRFYGP